MNSDPIIDQRLGPDPRREPTSVWDSICSGGERMRNRRWAECREPYFVDRFRSTTLAWILLLLAFTFVDGVLTLELIDADCHEVNPVMRYFLATGPAHFLVGKYVLTAAGLPVLLLFKNFRFFSSHFRVGNLIPIFVCLYVGVIAYQILLLRQLR